LVGTCAVLALGRLGMGNSHTVPEHLEEEQLELEYKPGMVAKAGNVAGAADGSVREKSVMAKMGAIEDHYAATGVTAFFAHLVNEDVSQARPLVLEVSEYGLGFASPKSPFGRFKFFKLEDEVLGWKSTGDTFEFVTVLDVQDLEAESVAVETQEWCLATGKADIIAATVSEAAQSALANLEVGVGMAAYDE